MAERTGKYLRADAGFSPEEISGEESIVIGDESGILDFMFVDLLAGSHVDPMENPRRELERLTNAIQHRVQQASAIDQVLLRWPWLAGPDEDTHIELIEEWLDRLQEVIPGGSASNGSAHLGVIQHRVAGDPLLRWTGETPSHSELATLLSHARAVELHALLLRNNAVWEPTTYHYRLPSGEHTDVFVRFADAIQSPRDAYVISCWLTDRLHRGIGIVVDTGGLTPVLTQIESFLARFDLEIGPTAILPSYPSGRPTVRRTVEGAIRPLVRHIMGIQTVSSSGNLLMTVTDELERVSQSRGLDYTLDVLVNRQEQDETCNRFSPVNEERTVTWLGLGDPTESSSTASCKLCNDPQKAHYVAIDPRTYGAMALPAPNLVMPDVGYADKASPFWERVASRKAIAIEANSHPRSRVARGRQVALPVRPIFELIAEPDGLREMVEQRVRQFGRSHEALESIRRTGLVVASAGDFATADRPRVAGGGEADLEAGLRSVLEGLSLNSSIPIVADDDPALSSKIEELGNDDAVLLFSWGSVTGLTLRRLKLSLADVLQNQPDDRSVNGLVFHSRPSTPQEWTALQNQFRPNVLLDLWTSCFPWESPLSDERRLLDRADLVSQQLSTSAQVFLKHRQRFLNLHQIHMNADDDWSPRFEAGDEAPKPEHIFWGMSHDDLYQTHVRGRSLYGKNLDCLTAYAAIGAVVNFTRLTERPAAAPRWVMFDLGRLVRSYFDAIITCSVIRWLRPGELWWGGDRDDPDSVRDSVSFLLDQLSYGNGIEESGLDAVREQVLLVPELLLACAQGKVPVTAHDLVCEKARVILRSWPDESSFHLARGAVEIGLALLEANPP